MELGLAYNIFVMTNMTEVSPDERISRVFRAISTPVRYQILMAIGKGEACVCHLEALLGLRQAYISQQLMELRQAGLLETRRDGRFIFYRVIEPHFLDLLADIGKLFGIPNQELKALVNSEPLPQCACPDCISQLSPLIGEQDINKI